MSQSDVDRRLMRVFSLWEQYANLPRVPYISQEVGDRNTICLKLITSVRSSGFNPCRGRVFREMSHLAGGWLLFAFFDYYYSVWLPPSRLSSSLLLSSFCCCLSFFLNLTKTLSVEKRLFLFLIICRPFSMFFSSCVYLTSSYSLFLRLFCLLFLVASVQSLGFLRYLFRKLPTTLNRHSFQCPVQYWHFCFFCSMFVC